MVSSVCYSLITRELFHLLVAIFVDLLIQSSSVCPVSLFISTFLSKLRRYGKSKYLEIARIISNHAYMPLPMNS